MLLEIYEILYKEYGPQHWWPGETQDEIVIGAILTQNTAWKNVEKAIANLDKNGLLSLSAIAKEGIERIARLIQPCGYYNIKAKRLKNVADFLTSYKDKKNCEQFRNALLRVNGVGRETADSILLYAFDLSVFVVDAYTRRIFSRLGIIRGNEPYDEISKMFLSSLPNSVRVYNEYHALIVRHGKERCKKQPLCSKCVLRDRCQNALQYQY